MGNLDGSQSWAGRIVPTAYKLRRAMIEIYNVRTFLLVYHDMRADLKM